MAYPKYQNGTTKFSKNPRHYVCHICESTISQREQSFEDHLKDKVHCLMFAYFSRFFEDKSNSNICKACNEWLPLDMAIEHANTHELVPLYHCEFETLFRDYISFRNNRYYCHLCNVKFLEWAPMLDHIEHVDHVYKWQHVYNVISDSRIYDLSLTLQEHKYAVNHFIFMAKQTFFCILCDHYVSGSFEEFVKHVMSSEHIKKEYEFDDHVQVGHEGQKVPVIKSKILDSLIHEQNDLSPRGRRRCGLNVSGVKEAAKKVLTKTTTMDDEIFSRESLRHGIEKIENSDFLTFRTCNHMTLIRPGSLMVDINGEIHQSNLQKARQLAANTSNTNSQSIIQPAAPSNQSRLVSYSVDNLTFGIEAIVGTAQFSCTICRCRITGRKNVQQHVDGFTHRTLKTGGNLR
uniref:C2H2-type domain-containing protein n=1 Tax=Bracon brevicornis TaxID=1563983 RepID=A0A6V7J745_9HYME